MRPNSLHWIICNRLSFGRILDEARTRYPRPILLRPIHVYGIPLATSDRISITIYFGCRRTHLQPLNPFRSLVYSSDALPVRYKLLCMGGESTNLSSASHFPDRNTGNSVKEENSKQSAAGYRRTRRRPLSVNVRREKIMKKLTIASICILVLCTGCRHNASAPTNAARADVPKSFEQAWVMSSRWEGYMGAAIALTPDRYYYWFYSDVKSEDEPEYPITGSYSFVNGKLRLNGSNHFYYATNWIVVHNGGRKCLSAERDVGDVARYLIPDMHFDPSQPFENQGTLRAEPTNAPYSSPCGTRDSKR